MVKRLASNYLQKKLYELLIAKSLTVLDVVTTDDVLPYVIIGEDREQKNKHSKDEDYKIIETSIEIFTEKTDSKKVKLYKSKSIIC